jgi:hypothetical protein
MVARLSGSFFATVGLCRGVLLGNVESFFQDFSESFLLMLDFIEQCLALFI